ncbi:hypothetical protein [Caballeronia calidae]|uniref:hypothetical protein n=1 Tax=Caballeronia calidae TaxID=1777139 RepID=UPI0018DF0D64|nr:hypothetical protein [Caballeronia calidae]
MIGPQNAITMQSSKTNLHARREKFSCKPLRTGFRRDAREPCTSDARTLSARRSLYMVRGTPKLCIDAINAIKCDQRMRSLFFRLICHAKVNRSHSEDGRSHESAGASLDQKTRRE